MLHKVRNSLVIRGGLALASISLIALFNMFASVFVADQTQGDAAAINMAGSLRMQSFKIGYLLQRAQSEADLEQVRDEATVLEEKFSSDALSYLLAVNHDSLAARHFVLIKEKWNEKLHPLLDDKVSRLADTREQYDHAVFDFVESIDRVVKLLQRETEDKIQLLLGIQGASMLLTVIVVFGAMSSLTSNVVSPLRKLVAAAHAVSKGNRSVRVEIDQDDELGQLARAFNLMAIEIAHHYADLERKVEEKTAELTRSNQSLELVYNATRKLTEDIHSKDIISGILQDLEAATNVEHVSLCLNESTKEKPFNPIVITEDELSTRCVQSNCDDCILHSIRQANFGLSTTDPSFPIRNSQDQFGVLFVQLKPGQRLEQWQVQLFQAVSDRISTAFSMAKRAEQESRFMLLEERNTIARELHDSLAQSLSYLKFQIGRLQMLQKKNTSQDEQEKVIVEMKDAINNAYGHLRELLTTFRLKINDPSLEQALRGTVAEFSQRGELNIQLDYGLRYYRLTPNEEIHLLQIVRESLSNIVRHAKASQASVSLEASTEGEMTLTIDDDGVGLQSNHEKLHHYGLSIMNERARNLGGNLSIGPSPMGGVRVQMKCQLDLYKNPTEQATT